MTITSLGVSFLTLSLYILHSNAQNCTDEPLTPSNCVSLYNGLCSGYNTLTDQYNSCGCGVNPCAESSVINYSKALHVASVFIILVASMLGSGLPLLSKYLPGFFRVSPFHICLGKCMGIGVVLACALVHMLQPSSQSLTSPCVPWEFNTDYNAYAFLYAMLAGLGMQFIDYCLLQYILSHQPPPKASAVDEELSVKKPPNCHVHGSFGLLDEKTQKTFSAYLLEFGVTVHSVFIGLTVGVADDSTLNALLVALCFHQFFEGVALGSRIADASLSSHWNEFMLSSIFSVAAPLGIGIGVAVISTLNPDGETFLMVQGTFDGICGGILLYIGYTLLLRDFPEDMEKHCADHTNSKYRRAAMFVALWLGAGLMAYIGKYL